MILPFGIHDIHLILQLLQAVGLISLGGNVTCLAITHTAASPFKCISKAAAMCVCSGLVIAIKIFSWPFLFKTEGAFVTQVNKVTFCLKG